MEAFFRCWCWCWMTLNDVKMYVYAYTSKHKPIQTEGHAFNKKSYGRIHQQFRHNVFLFLLNWNLVRFFHSPQFHVLGKLYIALPFWQILYCMVSSRRTRIQNVKLSKKISFLWIWIWIHIKLVLAHGSFEFMRMANTDTILKLTKEKHIIAASFFFVPC